MHFHVSRTARRGCRLCCHCLNSRDTAQVFGLIVACVYAIDVPSIFKGEPLNPP
jgi:hypothetical protein